MELLVAQQEVQEEPLPYLLRRPSSVALVQLELAVAVADQMEAAVLLDRLTAAVVLGAD